MRELAVDAANTATTDGTAQQEEIEQLAAELDSIGTRTKFAGNAVFQDYSATGAGLTFQIGANAGDELVFAADLTMSASAFSVDANATTAQIDVSADASAAIAAIDTAIGSVSDIRSELGAKQNRLEHTINNLSVAVENLTASESRVRDTDMAMEMANFTRHQILTQAGTAMLAQANQVPQNVLQLLRG
jgi:flagellin